MNMQLSKYDFFYFLGIFFKDFYFILLLPVFSPHFASVMNMQFSTLHFTQMPKQ